MSGWESRIEAGERVLWQGRPDGRILWSDIKSTEGAIGALLLLFPVIRLGIWLLAGSTQTGQVSVTEAIALLLGLWFTIGRLVFDAQRRRVTEYALTDRAAYVADRFFGRHLHRYPLREPLLKIEEGPFGLGHVWFAESQYRQRATREVRRATGSSIATINAPVGFRLIGEPALVQRLAREALTARARQLEEAGPMADERDVS
ncbi:hypothetical protein [Pseudoroseicyclus tamaricis]|uniref:PH (Pleckstrin Homology) domain-containing protein n=1 Tax=Pseudoroseicyclus tamaricis TaxID=2705421 RepID=A0A6B2JEX0_9RHOB|nr:hypothetical protein [Pseudoroseicyclus tamaricis]NDU99490.1 hypothetical protein [Pseudoroseicyclus tamaricis]